MRNMVRRLTVAATAFHQWQLHGYEYGGAQPETFDDVEVFGGVGFVSRPAAGSNAEAIVIKVGGEGGHPVVIASRDRDAQVEIDDDESAIFNSSGAVVKVTKDGDVEVNPAPGRKVYLRSDGGTSEALAKKSELDAAINQINSHAALFNVHSHPSHGAGPSNSFSTAPLAAGTTKVEAE